jgi:HlyD family secretion protein/GAF domain
MSSIEQINPTETLLELQSQFLTFARYDEAATTLLTSLCTQFGMERVTLGQQTDAGVEVVATAHQLVSPANARAYAECAQAMEESLMQWDMVLYPPRTHDAPRLIAAHAQYANKSNHQILSVPLEVQGALWGALLFEFHSAKLISDEEIQLCKHIALQFAPILQLKSQVNQSAWSLFKQHLKQSLSLSTWSSGKRNFVMVGLGLGLLLLFVPLPYDVGAPAKLEGIIQRVLVAPQDGFLQQSYVRPGDEVKSQQLLAELAEDELGLDLQKKQSELAQYQNGFGAALAGSDRVQMMTNQAKMQETQSQIELIEQKIQRTKILAPFDGVIIAGDLKQSIGSPVKQGQTLMTIAPKGGYRLMIEVSDRDVELVRPEQYGEVIFVSLPSQAVGFTVKRVNPVAVAKDGRNYFEVEAEMDEASEQLTLQPGLDGVAKIEAGSHSLFWKLTHRIVDWLRLKWWGIF